MATGHQVYIDFLASTGKGVADEEHIFKVRSCFPDMGNLEKTTVYFKGKTSVVLDLVKLFPKTRAPSVRKNHVKVSFLNPEIACEAKKQARKIGVEVITAPQKKPLSKVDFGKLPEKKIFKAESEFRVYYGRIGDKVLVLINQNGKEHGEYNTGYRIMTLSLEGSLESEEILGGHKIETGERYYVTEYTIARRILENRLGIGKSNSYSVPFHVEDGKVVVDYPSKKEIKVPKSLDDCFMV